MHGPASLRCVTMEKSSFNYRVYITNQQHPISLCNIRLPVLPSLGFPTRSGFFWSCLGFCVIVVCRVALYQSIVLVSIMMK